MNLSWDDLRLFLVVARAGSFSAGARVLGVNQSTVSRRVAQFEEQLATRLFDRLPRGLGLTQSGEALVRHAESVDAEFEAIAETIGGRDAELSGDILLATADTLALTIVDALAAFATAHPRVTVEVATSYQESSLAGREADVALRATRRPPQSAFGRRIASIAVAEYVATDTSEADRTAMGWIAPPASFSALDQTPKDARVVARQLSVLLVAASVRSGMGRAMVPCFVGDPDPRLRRVPGTLIPRVNDLWLLAHSGLRGRARVRALLSQLATTLEPMRPLFEGGCAT